MSKFFRVPDNYDQWVKHQAKQDDRLSDLPKCHKCNEPIQDDIVITIDGYDYCEECAKYEHEVEWRYNY